MKTNHESLQNDEFKIKNDNKLKVSECVRRSFSAFDGKTEAWECGCNKLISRKKSAKYWFYVKIKRANMDKYFLFCL